MTIEDIHILLFQQLLVFWLKLKFFWLPYSMKKERMERRWLLKLGRRWLEFFLRGCFISLGIDVKPQSPDNSISKIRSQNLFYTFLCKTDESICNPCFKCFFLPFNCFLLLVHKQIHFISFFIPPFHSLEMVSTTLCGGS